MEDIAQAILRRFRVILLVVLVFVGATLVVTFWQTPVYEASAKLVVGQEPDFSPKCQELPARNAAVGTRRPCYSGWELLPTINPDPPFLILPAVADAIDKRPVAEEVIQRLGLWMEPSELLENLSVEQEGSTVFIQLSYKDADPERAQQIVNTVGLVSSEWIPEAIGSADITVTMYEDALVPGSPVSPDPVRNSLLGLVLGLAAGIGLALLMDRRTM